MSWEDDQGRVHQASEAIPVQLRAASWDALLDVLVESRQRAKRDYHDYDADLISELLDQLTGWLPDWLVGDRR